MTIRSLSDRVAIVAMGCARFGEWFDKGADHLIIEAVTGIEANGPINVGAVDAFWLGTYVSGISGLTLSRPLRLRGKPVTRVENMCATGSDALRNACFAVASGAVDIAMAGLSAHPGRRDPRSPVGPRQLQPAGPSLPVRVRRSCERLPARHDSGGVEEPRERCVES